MKRLFIFALALGLASPAFSQNPPLKEERDKVSYSIGLDIGKTFKGQGMTDLNLEAITAGLRDGMAGTKPQLTEEDMRNTLQAYSKTMSEKQATKQKEDAARNSATGEKFLAENKSKAGVKTTESGLQYKVLKEGTGPQPKETDTVVTHYRGTLIDGTEFDSSYERKEPATFPVNRVIKGWTEALQMMKVGSKYQLFVPADLAYGARGSGGDIGPNETLIFEVELLDIKKDDAPVAGGSPGAAPSPKPQPKPQEK